MVRWKLCKTIWSLRFWVSEYAAEKRAQTKFREEKRNAGARGAKIDSREKMEKKKRGIAKRPIPLTTMTAFSTQTNENRNKTRHTAGTNVGECQANGKQCARSRPVKNRKRKTLSTKFGRTRCDSLFYLETMLMMSLMGHAAATYDDRNEYENTRDLPTKNTAKQTNSIERKNSIKMKMKIKDQRRRRRRRCSSLTTTHCRRPFVRSLAPSPSCLSLSQLCVV